MSEGYIYKHTNLINGKVYIGQTTQKPEIRWGKDGVNYSSQKAFYRDICKYGWNNFSHDVLEIVEANSDKELKRKLNNIEGHYILKFESLLFKKGYNAIINSDTLSAKFTLSANRVISKHVESGMTIIDAYNLYKKDKKTRRCNVG